jgi:hypothetical protein
MTPVLVIDGATEPTTVNPVHETPLPQVADDVETLPKVFAPVKYGMLPTTAAEDVERPSNPTVEPVTVMGQVPETEAR